MKRKFKKIGLVIIVFLALVACEKEKDEDGSFAKQIRIQFGWAHGTSSDQWTIPDNSGFSLYNFNKANYTNISSIKFGAFLQSSDNYNNCIIELYDLTNGAAINNSRLESNSTVGEFIISDNLLNDIPNGTIDFSYRIKSENDGIEVNSGFNFYLFIEQE